MKVLITGGTGFIGSNLAKRLLEEGFDVYVLARHLRKPMILELLGVDPGKANVVMGDVCCQARMLEICRKYSIDFVFHLAAASIVKWCVENPALCIRTNVWGTVNILEVCRMLKIPAIIQSTDKIYGEGMDKRENSPTEPVEIYGASKLAADALARAYRRTYELPITVVRPCNTYGPGDLNPRIIPNTIKACMRNQSPVIFLGVKGVREYVYVDDLVDALLLLMERIWKADEVYNIGSGEVKTQEEVVMEVLKHFPKCKPRYVVAEPRREIEYQSLDSSKIRKLGWKPKVSFSDGITLTVEWFRSVWNSLKPALQQ